MCSPETGRQLPLTISIAAARAACHAQHTPGWWNGRHKGLKIPRPQGCAGSSPAPGTKQYQGNPGFVEMTNPGFLFLLSVQFAYAENLSNLPQRITAPIIAAKRCQFILCFQFDSAADFTTACRLSSSFAYAQILLIFSVFRCRKFYKN